MFNKILEINCERSEYILTMRCHSWTTFSPPPPLPQKAGNKNIFISKKRYWQSVQFQPVLACLSPPKLIFAIPLTLHFPLRSTGYMHAHACSSALTLLNLHTVMPAA